MISVDRNAAKVRAGRAGAKARWGEGPVKVLRISDLTPAQRALVVALVEAARAAKASDDAA